MILTSNKFAWLLIVLLLLHSNVVSAQESNFIKVQLPDRVSIDLPKSWIVVSDDITQLVETYVESSMKSENYSYTKSNFMFMAQGEFPFAQVIVRSDDGKTYSQSDIDRASDVIIKSLNKGFYEGSVASYKPQNSRIIEWYGTGKVKINGRTCILYEFKRTSIKDPSKAIFVRNIVIYLENRAVYLTLSYMENDLAILYKQIIDHVLHSIKA
jgi:hypothetical protein